MYVANVLNTEQTQLSTRHNLAKKYIEGETKEQRKARKRKEKQAKALDEIARLDQEMGLLDLPYNANPLIKDKYYVLCLKHGTKYSADYVNKLYNMVMRNCTLDIEFVCLTEDSAGINENVKILPLPKGLAGWWCKPYVFSNDLPLKGTILYMDLDVVIASNIDKLFTYQPDHWCTIRDFTRAMRPKWHKYNSSVVRFNTGQLNFVWEEFSKDPAAVQKRYFGDQDYLFDITLKRKQAMLYPDSWIQSWKWEVRKSKLFAHGGTKGNRRFAEIENVKPRVECCVCVFHGDPNPSTCFDPWVVDNWK